MTDDIGQIAAASYAAACGLVHPDVTRQGAASAVAAGVVDCLVDDARAAARSVAPAPSDDAARGVWAALLEMLADSGLSPALYCTKTGRRLGHVSPDAWGDYLRAIGQLGDTRAGDDATRRLLDAITAQKAHCVGPAVLHTSGASLALIRRVSPADYLCIASARLWPLLRGASAIVQAVRAETLGAMRARLDLLPDAALQYACEVVTLYLANIDPARVPVADNLLAHYAGDFAAPFQSVATLGHFCGRLVQMLTALIARHRPRPLAAITRQDMRALRVHWVGLKEYQTQKADRAALRHAMRQADFARLLTGSERAAIGIASRALAGNSAVSALDDFAASFLDALDLQAALAATGRAVPLAATDAQEASKARKVAAAWREDAGGDDLADGDLLDLSALLASGDVPADLLPTIDNEDDLVTAGLMSVSDILAFDWSGDEYDEDEDEDAQADMPPDLLADAMAIADARRDIRKPAALSAGPAKPAKIDPNLATIAALEAALSGPAMTPQPAPVRRRVVASAGTATPAPLPNVTPPTPSGSASPAPALHPLRRRVVT